MTAPTSSGTTFDQVLKCELEAINTRRRLAFTGYTPPPPIESPSDSPYERIRQEALEHDLVGLAFSGGGIRSATVNLGILQGLARHGLLKHVDYLSTVSGGGYVGAWLSAWIQREHSLANVESQLSPERMEQANADRYAGVTVDANGDAKPDLLSKDQVLADEPEPVRHLRAYSRYLAPNFGWFSLDALALASLYVRNLLITALPMLLLGLGLVMASRAAVWFFGLGVGATGVAGTNCGGYALALFLMLFGISYGFAIYEHRRLTDHRVAERSSAWYFGFIVAPLLVASPLGAWALAINPETVFDEVRTSRLHEPMLALLERLGISDLPSLQVYLALSVGSGALLAFTALFAGIIVGVLTRTRGFKRLAVTTIRAFIIGLIFGIVVPALSAAVAPDWQTMKAEYAKLKPGQEFGRLNREQFNDAVKTDKFFLDGHQFDNLLTRVTTLTGPPILILVIILVGYLEVGLAGAWFTEREREWRARIAAMLMQSAIVWLGFYLVTLFLWPFVEYLSEVTTSAFKHVTATAWVMLLAALLRASSTERVGQTAPSRWKAFALSAVPAFLLAGFAVLLSQAASVLVHSQLVASIRTWLEQSFNVDVELWNYWENGDPKSWLPSAFLGGLVIAGFGLALVWMINVNMFSLHSVYGNRLTRCYLGASRRKQDWARRGGGMNWRPGPSGAPTNVDPPIRLPGSFTDFDPADDFPLFHLRIGACPTQTPGPLHLLNTTLNLVGSPDPAARDRKADSFVLSPYFCGSALTNYAETCGDVQSLRNLTLGRAMTISGAAADPNMNVNQSFVQTALMTLLNIRLGAWIENPRRRPAWRAGQPTTGSHLLSELLGRTNATDSYVHLSDGGHFENLGVYELIRRRCRYIVAIDAAEDPSDASENLANLIRLIRIDFGIEVEIDTAPLRKDEQGLSRAHAVVGSIRYDEVDINARAGVFVFVRSSLTGDESPDIRKYREVQPDFPHHSTADQFFDNDQFESYRALGHHIAHEVFGETAQKMRMKPDCESQRIVRSFFVELRHRWSAQPAELDQRFVEVSASWAGLLADLGNDANLRALNHELYPELHLVLGSNPNDQEPVAAMRIISRAVRLMETFWLQANLDQNHGLTINRGWMNAFRRLAATPSFFRLWPMLASSFSAEFIQFCQHAFSLPEINVVPVQMADFVVKNGVDSLQSLIREFKQEWADRFSQYDPEDAVYDMPFEAPVQPFGRDPRLRLVRDLRAAMTESPCAWVIRLLPGDELLREAPSPVVCSDFPCGLVLLLPDGADLELFVWIRGPYRSSRMGRQVLDNILRGMAQAGEDSLGGVMKNHHRLIARCPYRGDVPAERNLQSMWLNLFYELDFRRRYVRAAQRKAARDLPIIVEQRLPLASAPQS